MKPQNRTLFHEDVEKVLSRGDDSTFTLIYPRVLDAEADAMTTLHTQERMTHGPHR